MAHALRYPVTIVLLVLAAHASDIWKLASGRAPDSDRGASRRSAHVILVVADGLRWQEVFTGADSLLLFHSSAVGDDAEAIRRRYWRATPAAHDALAAVQQAVDSFAEGYERAQRLAVRQEVAARREFIDDLPRTLIGKVSKKDLPMPGPAARPELDSARTPGV